MGELKFLQEQMGKRFIRVALVLLLLLLIAEAAGQELERETAEKYEDMDLAGSARCLEAFGQGTEIFQQKTSEQEAEMSAQDENGVLADFESQQPEVSYEGPTDEEYMKEFEVYRDVLQEYAQAIGEDADETFVTGKWKYVYDLLYGPGKKYGIYYSLKNMSNHDNRELIMGILYKGEYIPYVVYGDWGNGIVFLCVAERYEMTIYEGGTIELVGGGLNYVHMYYQFGEELIVEVLEVQQDGEITNYSRKMFFGRHEPMTEEIMAEEEITEEEITEEEYLEIIERYTAVPAELEWMPLV